MALKLDNTLLDELGLTSLPPEEKSKMLAHIYETLEMRVGVRLAEQMSEQQLQEFERFIGGDTAYAQSFLDQVKPGWGQSDAYQAALTNARTDAERRGTAANEGAVTAEFAALTWLETTFPSYKAVVAEEFDKLKSEIKAVAPQIVAEAQQQSNGAAPAQQPPLAPSDTHTPPPPSAPQPPQY